MRILHTSDWHIGRTFHGHSTLDALTRVLDALVDQVRASRVDLVVVAGDVFDSAAPSAACYPVLSRTLGALVEAGARVLVTSGNHDSAARLGFQSGLLRPEITVVTDPASVGTPVTVHDEHGPVHVYGIPYLEPAIVRHLWPGVELRSQAQTMTHALDLVRADLAARGGRSVVAAHCFAAGVEATPGVEREIRQGGLDVVPLSAFDGPDYVPSATSTGGSSCPSGSATPALRCTTASARRQAPRLVADRSRRLGSARGGMDAAARPASTRHRARSARQPAHGRALRRPPRALGARGVHRRHPADRPHARLQERFPWCATVAHLPAGTRADDSEGYARRVRAARDDAEVIDAFLAHVREGEGASDAERSLVREVLDAHRVSEAHA